MATINLGSIKFNWKGAYNSSTAYAVDDVVSSGGNSYVCIQASTGNAVGNATAYWNIMSSAGTNGSNGSDGTDLTTTLTTQSDILYRDGSGLQRLPKGTASQVLAINSGATAPEWVTPATGGAISSATVQIQGSFSTTSSNYNSLSTPLSITVTPTSTSSKFLLLFDAHSYANGGYLQVNGFKNGAVLTGSAAHFLRTNLTNWHPIGLHILDAPNTTSSITYEIKSMVTAGTGTIGDGNNYTNQFSVIEL